MSGQMKEQTDQIKKTEEGKQMDRQMGRQTNTPTEQQAGRQGDTQKQTQNKNTEWHSWKVKLYIIGQENKLAK